MADTPPVTNAKGKQAQVRNITGDSFSCIMALLQFILADPLLRSAIIGFLETCKAQIVLQKTLLQATIAQLTVTLSLLETEVSAISAVFSIADGLSSRFPLDVFSRCPLTAGMVAAAHNGIPSLLPGGGSGVTNAITWAKTQVRDLQYKVARMNQVIQQTNAAIERCTLFIAQIDAIEEFINALANLPPNQILPLN